VFQSLLQSCEMADKVEVLPGLNHRRVQGRQIDGQVKDVDSVTKVGRLVRQNFKQKSSDFRGSLGGMPTLNRQNAITGLEAMASPDLPN